ncbi:O-antigen ligase family protein [Micrococcaceae bacterium Sec5.1]
MVTLRRRSLEAGLLLAFLVLLTARSVILPGWASQLAPLLAVGLMVVGALPHVNRLVLPPIGLGVALLVAIYVTSSVTTSGNTDYFFRSVSVGFLWLVSAIVGANLYPKEKSLFLTAILLICLLELVFSFAETILGISGVRTVISADQAGQYIVRPNTILGEWTNRAQGSIGYPIPLAHLFSIGIAVALFSRLRIRSIWRIASSLGFLVGILLTGTRSGIAAAVAVVALGLIASLRASFTVFKLLVLVVAALGAVLMAALFSSEEKFSSDGSFTHRVGVVSSVGEILKLPPLQIFFGSGFNSHEKLFTEGYFGTQGTFAVDNAFVTILIYTGIFGLLIFLALIAGSIGRGEPVIVAVVGAFLAFGLSYDFINWHLMGFMLFIFLGLSVGRMSPAFSRFEENRITFPSIGTS